MRSYLKVLAIFAVTLIRRWNGGAMPNQILVRTRRPSFSRSPARAFLAMQASSASAERLLSAAGRVEDAMRHNQSAAVLEMTLVIRAFVKRELGLDGQKLVYSDVGSAYGKLIKIMAAKIASIRARDQS
jgi:hypothetical protein